MDDGGRQPLVRALYGGLRASPIRGIFFCVPYESKIEGRFATPHDFHRTKLYRDFKNSGFQTFPHLLRSSKLQCIVIHI